MDCKVSIIGSSLVLVSVCCIVWLCKEFIKLIRWIVTKTLKELEEE